MAQILDNCEYNNVKLLHEFSCMSWFLKKHAIPDAQKANDPECVSYLQKLEQDLDEHLKQLKAMNCESCR